MEKKVKQNEKFPRVIQLNHNNMWNGHIWDNRLGGHRNYLSGAPLQRVIQRENEANGHFEYIQEIHDHKDRVPYTSKKIRFADYSDGSEILSADFNGCYMMAFHFNQAKSPAELNALLPAPSNVVTRGGTFVAHVASDARDVLWDAIKRGLIIVQAIFRPYNNWSKDLPKTRYGPVELTERHVAFNKTTGGMRRLGTNVDSPWVAKVYSQEKVPTDWEAQKGKTERTPYSQLYFTRNDYDWHISESAVIEDPQLETKATLAYVYARVCLEDLIQGRWSVDQTHPALAKLLDIKRERLDAIQLARDRVLIQGEDQHKNVVTGLVFNSEDIAGFFSALEEGSEKQCLEGLQARLIPSKEEHNGCNIM